jgi:hypothetical protein
MGGRLLRWSLALLVLGLGYGLTEVRQNLTDTTAPATEAVDRAGGGERQAEQAILDAFAQHESGMPVQVTATVTQVLADDLQGARHQRFIVRLAGGHTLLVSHNIDIADRVPVARGDIVTLRGEYEWNDRGGVVHWTHHDPQGRREGGFIEHQGRRYE